MVPRACESPTQWTRSPSLRPSCRPLLVLRLQHIGPQNRAPATVPCNLGPDPQGRPPSPAAQPPGCPWGDRGYRGGLDLGRRRGWAVTGARLLTPLLSLPADELELVPQDGQRCVRARCSLAEGLSWGPFRGSIQSRASSPGQEEPVRNPDPWQPPTSHWAAAS